MKIISMMKKQRFSQKDPTTVQYPCGDALDALIPSTDTIEEDAHRAFESSARLASVIDIPSSSASASASAPPVPDLQQTMTAQAVSEQLLGEADEVSDARRKHFWDFQNSVNISSAKGPFDERSRAQTNLLP